MLVLQFQIDCEEQITKSSIIYRPRSSHDILGKIYSIIQLQHAKNLNQPTCGKF